MKIGLLAYSSNTGLGYQTWDFAKNIGCEKILIADLSKLNQMETHHERFQSLAEHLKISDGIPSDNDVEWLTDDVDFVFICETPLNWNLFKIAEQKGVKSILQYNYEFLQYFRTPNYPAPTVLASPSFWEMERVEALNIAQVRYLPVPVNIEKIDYRENEKVETLVHIMGRPAQNDRNGTRLFMQMVSELGDKYNYKLYLQTPKEMESQRVFHEVKPLFDLAKEVLGDKFEIHFDIENNVDMYKEGEVMILPRRYGGLCLPLWEALASGMPVLMPNISPNDKVLSEDWLCEARHEGYVTTHSDIPMYTSDIKSMIETLHKIENNYSIANKLARGLAESMSWSSRKKDYIKLFEELCD